LIAPLIGAGASQALLIFRNLTRRGTTLLSFEYQGHPRSTGTFELDRTIADCRHALTWAWRYASELGVPLHGLSTCYGTVPLLAQFAGPGCGLLLKSLNAVSGLFRLDQIIRFQDFAQVLSRRTGRRYSVQSLLAEIAEGTLDCDADPFRSALREFLSGLFPELRVGWDGFEELRYDRVHLARTIVQLAQARYLDRVSVPARVLHRRLLRAP
jgi:hypothetical protein